MTEVRTRHIWTGNREPALDELLDDATIEPLLRLWRLEAETVRAEMRAAAARLKSAANRRLEDAA